MCLSCYDQYGAPTLDNPTVRGLAAAIVAVYDHEDGIVGGPLHVILDDWNIEDDSVASGYYEEWIADARWDNEMKALATSCLTLLRRATLEERASALHRAHSGENQ